MTVAREIFKAYDIRGIVDKQLTEQSVLLIGRAIGSEAKSKGLEEIVIGRDGRLSGPMLSAALAQGLRESGLNVIDVGMVATPMLYFASYQWTQFTGVMVTGSHNPPEYNGFKIVLGGETLSGEAIQALRLRIENNQFTEGHGSYREANIDQLYRDTITKDVHLHKPLKIVVDCGSGIPGRFAPDLYRQLGCEVIELFCEVDGHFPHHHPDPSQPENLEDLVACVKREQADLGLAFDGDGDRLGVVTALGEIIYPDRQLMLFAQDVLSRNPGATILFDVKCTRHLFSWIRRFNGEPLIWKTGHSLIKAKMKETHALLAGEMSGHVFFKERWFGFDDGLYAGARLLEILSATDNPTATLEALPNSICTPELQIKLEEGENKTLISALQEFGKFELAEDILTLDGVRVEYKDGFGLARSSNTTPVVVLRFEADNNVALDRIKEDFRTNILKIFPGANLPY
ncbi:MAG: phosphomannomutase/phosphoglucomutase [Ferrovum sp. 37-45-19]|uniref:phosphomannomutase/phosphoglucomutase n=1 Tax=Ferrovum sp. JA12 TaxID=1356299 RepID=UPI0007033C2C|nr:phosphomannomutase/phosphoglucomutase [Ferrovum sp. JA12]OYV80191.1 MAG: phosphomannomutase/phosphoglucomutase [Ferrovum sp. 21-44-67]OYV94468.1 MAG: phosphomannomutase/phosphoglucomutase [Ferrovum sp. 37-45-19]OZB32450.1 MAG: phosphomannomutase/phosphoglucomutase [Ferrovum sp. 34-44-207]HQT81634.1 phosphomannomutase/phosphoglucomutase [Ferrovaceae bacterium]KRH78871.1 phosphomannomutase/phosphoglucomutase [Ferrovum sp. JA12]